MLTLYSVCIEETPLLSEEKHCKLRLSLKGEKRKKKKACLCPFFFSIKKKKILGRVGLQWAVQAQLCDWDTASSPGHLAAASNSTGRLGEQALHGQADFPLRQHMLNFTVHGAENTSTSDAPHTANPVNSRWAMEDQMYSVSVACTAPLYPRGSLVPRECVHFSTLYRGLPEQLY